jgi:hypothetical protein
VPTPAPTPSPPESVETTAEQGSGDTSGATETDLMDTTPSSSAAGEILTMTPTPASGLEGWMWALIGIAALCCVLCVLYFIAFASLPKQGEEEARLEALITELEDKHPDIDFDDVRKEIYAELPDVSNGPNASNYGKLSSIEAKMLVDEAVKLHDVDKRKSRKSIFNPPFRGMFRKLPPTPVGAGAGNSGAGTSQYGKIPDPLGTSGYGRFNGGGGGGGYGIAPSLSSSSSGATHSYGSASAPYSTVTSQSTELTRFT